MARGHREVFPVRSSVFLSFNEGYKNFARVRDLLASIDCLEGLLPPEHILGGYYDQTFDATDPKLAALRELLKREGIKWSEREEHVYTDDELRSFPLLELSVDRNPLDAGGPQYGTAYDLSKGCPRCGCGAIQCSPLLLPMSGFPKKGLLCATVFHEILVAEPLNNALREANVAGLELRQVRFYRNDEPLPWWQMMSAFEMPEMSSQSRGVVTDETDTVMEDGKVIHATPPCPKCRRDGRYHTNEEPCEIVYNRTEVDPATIPDVVHTWEAFGRSWIDREHPERSWYGEHRILMKPKVFDIFRSLKVKHACFGPVSIVD
jgi:hypothetical protein